MRRLCLALAVLGVGNAAAASAAEVERSVRLARPAAAVWAMAGPFCAIASWHPAIARCEALEIDGKPFRRLTTTDRAAFLERELARDEVGMAYRYAIERSPLPVERYRSTFRVEPDGAGAKVVWRADFAVASGKDEAATVAAISGIYEAGLAGLAAKVAP
jgi:hypothetical protein